jgi:hypothetical protein
MNDGKMRPRGQGENEMASEQPRLHSAGRNVGTAKKKNQIGGTQGSGRVIYWGGEGFGRGRIGDVTMSIHCPTSVKMIVYFVHRYVPKEKSREKKEQSRGK